MAQKSVKQMVSSTATESDRYALYASVREAQAAAVVRMQECAYDLDAVRDIARQYTTGVLLACRPNIGRGENMQSICSVIGRSTAITGLYPPVRNGAAAVWYRFEDYVRRLPSENPIYGPMVELAGDLNLKRMPFSAETAAMADIALNVCYFDNVRACGKGREGRAAADKLFIDTRNAMFNAFAEDCVDFQELTQANQAIVSHLVKAKEDPYLYKFSNIWDEQRVDLSQIQKCLGPVTNGKRPVVYLPPLGALSYKKGGGRFVYRFEYRPPYTFNMYDDMLYEEMKEHYGPVLKSSRTGDKSYLETPAYKASQARVQQIRTLMKTDNYTDAEIGRVMRAVGNRCELYYSTETDDGREEWAKAHPEEAKLLEEEKARREAGEAAKRQHIKIQSERKEEPDDWLVPSEEGYEPELMRQAGSKLQPGVSLASTFSEQDYIQLASIMAEFADRMNPLDDAYNLEKWYVPLKADPEACLDRFVSKYFRSRMDRWQRRRYELVSLARKTAEPLVDKDSCLVATRSIKNVVDIGDTGGKVRGSSHVGDGCWVDARSGVTNTKLKGNIILAMQTNVRDSELSGVGMVVNSIINGCSLSGTLDPSEMRKAEGLGTNPARTLNMSDREETYGQDGDEAENKKELERIKAQMLLRIEQFKDKTVEEYIQMMNDIATSGRDGLSKLTPQELRVREEEERRRKNEQARLQDNTGRNYAEAKEIQGAMKRIGVPANVRARMAGRAAAAARVDSVDLTVEKGRIIDRHERITEAIASAKRTEAKQLAGSQVSVEEDFFPGSKPF